MFAKVVDGVIQKEIVAFEQPGFYPLEGLHPDNLKFDNYQDAVFNGEKVIISPIERDISSAKAWVKERLYAFAKELQDRVFSKYSSAELITFPEKKRQAQLLQETGDSSKAPMLVEIANKIAEKTHVNAEDALEELKNSILDKLGFEEITQQIEANRKAKSIRISNIESVEELVIFYYSTEWKEGWPV
jgi:hypothetical protein